MYQFIAVKMTDRENHRTATAYEDALIVKLFLFQFVNHYSSFYYLAFVHIQPFHVRELGNCIAGPAPTTPATYAPTPAPSIMLEAEQVSAGCLQARRNATRRGTTRAVATLLFVCLYMSGQCADDETRRDATRRDTRCCNVAVGLFIHARPVISGWRRVYRESAAGVNKNVCAASTDALHQPLHDLRLADRRRQSDRGGGGGGAARRAPQPPPRLRVPHVLFDLVRRVPLRSVV